jgi:hypothetical protein
MMKQGQDVDEWLLGGLTDNALAKSNTYKKLIE